jgi:hypothetical protein
MKLFVVVVEFFLFATFCVVAQPNSGWSTIQPHRRETTIFELPRLLNKSRSSITRPVARFADCPLLKHFLNALL